MICNGHKESEILEYSYDKFNYYLKAAVKKETSIRIKYVLDTCMSIAGAFSKKDTINDYIETLEKVIKDA